MIRIAIAGGSGYAGGELLRLCLQHPQIEIAQVTSERQAGKRVSRTHPNLRGQTDLKFVSSSELGECDTLFLCLPHGQSQRRISEFENITPHIIDLAADFRLSDLDQYEYWYNEPHQTPEKLDDFCYGIVELYRDRMQSTRHISSAGCNATASILGLLPMFKARVVDPDRPMVLDVKVGSSEGGRSSSEGSHHPERSGSLRSYKLTGHRHSAEIIQELSKFSPLPDLHMSATATDRIRGILMTGTLFLKEDLTEKDIWKLYRQYVKDEPFLRLVKERSGHFRYPDPKLLSGSNYCDIGFELEGGSRRLVVVSAIDNLMKGAAGQALQAFNVMHNIAETTGLTFPGLHPA